MNRRENNWEKIVNLPDDYQPNQDLAQNAIKKIKARKINDTKRMHKTVWTSIAASFAVFIVGLSVFLPIYLTASRNNEKLYYSNENVTFSPIEDISGFVAQNNLDIFYFDNNMTTSHCAYTTDDNKLAFISQSTVFVEESHIAIVTMKIVLLKNADFYFCVDYNGLTDSLMITGTKVYYLIPDVEEQLCRIRFTLNNVTYYIDIDSDYYSLETIEKYITLLIA